MKLPINQSEKKNRSGISIRNFDRNSLPAHRFLRWLIENEPNRKLLIPIEILLLAGTGITCWIYFH